MPLGDTTEYFSWIEREAPSTHAQGVARAFLLVLDERPWAAPSVPVPDLSHQPDYEVRTASLHVGDTAVVTIWWAHVYANAQVDVLAITLL